MREFFILSRIQTAGLTALTALFGMMAQGEFSSDHCPAIACCFIIGLCAHFHGFITNEILDLPVDRGHSALSAKPLVSGTITIRRAFAYTMIPVIVTYAILALFYLNGPMLLLFFCGHASSLIYNGAGKKFPGLDIFLGIWAFTFCIFGALAPALAYVPFDPTGAFLALPGNIGPFVYIIASLGGLQLLFNNSVEGGIKDAENDLRSGVRSLATRVLGVRVKGGRIYLTAGFRLYAIAVKGLSLLLFFWPLLTPGTFGLPGGPGPLRWALSLILLLAVSGTLLGFLRSGPFDRNRLKRIFSAHEFVTYLMVPLLLSNVLSPGILLFIILFPIAWFVLWNRLLYGTLMNPAV